MPARLLERLEQAQVLIVEADITVSSPLLTGVGGGGVNPAGETTQCCQL
ncbi:hypothetical protein [Sodalis-like endosymbiont of Proechinophthirus fluctus]|nr:hypothetical protein [Sodalis-like endosymbiont of Proechinophthirus fluctus]